MLQKLFLLRRAPPAPQEHFLCDNLRTALFLFDNVAAAEEHQSRLDLHLVGSDHRCSCCTLVDASESIRHDELAQLFDKPVIAAIEGPAVAGGMELGLWCDFRVMAEGSYFGVYCRRWGVPLIDGGTVRLPRIVGQGRALEIILTGRKVPAEECLAIGLCEYLTPKGGARAKAEALAREIARFPQVCVRADRRSAIKSHGLGVREALIQEWYNGREALIADGVAGASRFKDGLGRHGDFEKIE